MWLDAKPTQHHLDELICCQVASNCERLAVYLGVEQQVINAAKEDHCLRWDEATGDVQNRWLQGEHDTSSTQRSWHSILTALRESREEELVEQLSTDWFR